MLGKTAGGLFWMFRQLERSENIARLVDVGFRIALTRSAAAEDEWASVITTAGVRQSYLERYDQFTPGHVIDFLLREPTNSSSVYATVKAARDNARLVRTALTREVWEATNECWIVLKEILAKPVPESELPSTLNAIRQQSALVRGALHGTMLRNDIYDFARLGTFLERADNTARILDVKYYVLLPSVMQVGSSLDNVHWETILRSVSAQRGYRWVNGGDVNPMGIADFLIFDRRMPRSLAFCYTRINDNLKYLADDYGDAHTCQDHAGSVLTKLRSSSINSIMENGLHEFIEGFLRDNAALGAQIEKDYLFYG